jgi:SAM-dependent methyltransferase
LAHQNGHYEQFFEKGGWHYDLVEEKSFLQNRVASLAGWQPPARILEVGAGMGHHAELLRQLGFSVTALEAASSGVAYMQRHYPSVRAVCADSSSWAPSEQADHLFVRGMSYFHYELHGTNSRGVDVVSETRRMFQWLKPGGTFVLQIVTDFSGRKQSHLSDADNPWAAAVHMNRLDDFVALFTRFGEVLAHTDWKGRRLPLDPVPSDATGIIIVTRRPLEADTE